MLSGVRIKSLVLAAGVALGLILAAPPTAFAIDKVTRGDRTDVVKLTNAACEPHPDVADSESRCGI
jgi:hypothetical protein